MNFYMNIYAFCKSWASSLHEVLELKLQRRLPFRRVHLTQLSRFNKRGMSVKQLSASASLRNFRRCWEAGIVRPRQS